RLARRGRMLDWAGESQYYAEPKRLAWLGYLEAREEPGRTRERTGYRLKEKGLGPLRSDAPAPAAVTPLTSEPRPRLLSARLVGGERTRKSLVALRADLAALRDRLDQGEQTAATLPHRQKYLLIVIEFLRRYLDLHEELIDEVERELAPPRAAGARG